MRNPLRGTALLLLAAGMASPAWAEGTTTTTAPTTTTSSAAPTTTTAAKAAPPPGPQQLVFPVAGRVRFTDTFGASRQGGKRKHEGQDLIGAKMTPLVSPVNGIVTKLTIPQPSTGYGLVITDADGWMYKFVHINNDSLGSDDGKAQPNLVYGPGIAKGTKVSAGQLVAFLGDSGNAEGTVPHVHFEVRTPKNAPVNAYRALVDAVYLDRPAGLPAGYELPPLGTTEATPKKKASTCSTASTSSTSTSSTSTTAAGEYPTTTTTATATTTTAKPTCANKQPAKKKTTSTTARKKTTTSTTAKKKSTTSTTAKKQPPTTTTTTTAKP